jgi:YHS domain-containing protein
MFLAYGQVTAQGESARKKHFNLKNGVALSGYDPVSYFKGGPVKGKESLSYLYKGILYHFGSQANLEAFKASPERYEPSYGGWCAYAMGATGEKVSINPETFKIIDDKLYLFYNQFFTNTLTSWNKDEASLHKKADAQWNRTIHHISQ